MPVQTALPQLQKKHMGNETVLVLNTFLEEILYGNKTQFAATASVIAETFMYQGKHTQCHVSPIHSLFCHSVIQLFGHVIFCRSPFRQSSHSIQPVTPVLPAIQWSETFNTVIQYRCRLT
jgi:hypothetical protein